MSKKVGLIVAATMAFSGSALAEESLPGVTPTEITVGMTFPFSGPASALGNTGKGLAGYVNRINDNGGINGRNINLIALDDAYTPSKSVEQTRKLVESDNVAFIFSPLGTASLSATVKYLNDRKVPQLFIVTGGTKFTNYAAYPYTTTGLPSFTTEGRIYAKFITSTLPKAKIGILYQNDDMGKDLVASFKSYMKDDYADKVEAKPYEVTDPTVDSQIVTLRNSGAEAVFFAGSPKFAAQTIRKINEIGWKPLIVLNYPASSVAATLAPAGLERSIGVVSGTFQKDPADPAWANDPAVKEYLAFLVKYIPGGDPAESAYILGAMQGQILEQILKQCRDDLSRENIIKQARNLKEFSPAMALPGIAINTGATNNQAWTQMQLQRWTGKSWERFSGLMGAED